MAEGEDQQFSDVTAGSEPVFDFYCELCREESKMIEAEGYCMDCEEYLCSTCFTHHRRTRYSRQHVLLDKDKMPKDTPLSYDRVNKDISKTCDNHAGKPIEYYCKSHDFLGCNMCFFEGHRNCSDVENIIKEADTIMESQEYKDFLEMLDQFDQRASDNIKLVKENLDKSKTCCTEVSKSLQKFREEINSILDELEKKLVKQTEDIQKTEENKLMDISTKVTTTLESVEKMKGELSQLQISRKACEIYIKLKESKREAKQIQRVLSDNEKENIARVYVFDPNSQLKETLKNLNKLGNILFQDSVTTPATTAPTPAKTVFESGAKTVTGPAKTATAQSVPLILPHCNTINTKATHFADIDIKFDKEQYNGTISGSAVMSYNRLIIVDHYNCKIKLVDTASNKLISEVKVASKPWDVTKISRNQAAATLPGSNKILLLSVLNTLTLDREINVSGMCEGVAYSQNRLLVSYKGPPKLEIMNLYGKVLKEAQHWGGGNRGFEPLLQYVCMSNNDETIYVSDRSGHKVTSLTFDGVPKAVYRDNELKNPTKVCVDHNDNVFVCSGFSKNVHMLTSDLTKIQIILTRTHGLYNNVHSISHCQATNRLYIGMWDDRKVKVFQLSQ